MDAKNVEQVKLTEEQLRQQDRLDQIQHFDDLIDLCLMLGLELRTQQENVRVNEDLDMQTCGMMATDLLTGIETLDPEFGVCDDPECECNEDSSGCDGCQGGCCGTETQETEEQDTTEEAAPEICNDCLDKMSSKPRC
jgi:hypothetical protein